MPQHHSIEEIINRLEKAKNEMLDYCSSITDEHFFYTVPGKWSVAQQVKHLIISANMSRLAFSLPKFIVRWIAGKPNRTSRTYEELVDMYTSKLEKGGRASGRFIPKPISNSYGKETLLTEFSIAMNKISQAIKKNGDGNILDAYLSPHPLLGKITLRELCYFTIYHTHHHLKSIRNQSITPNNV